MQPGPELAAIVGGNLDDRMDRPHHMGWVGRAMASIRGKDTYADKEMTPELLMINPGMRDPRGAMRRKDVPCPTGLLLG